MYTNIINPYTNRKVSMNTKLGKNILIHYMNHLNGGAESKHSWNCEYCTYENPISESKICSICSKTNDTVSTIQHVKLENVTWKKIPSVEIDISEEAILNTMAMCKDELFRGFVSLQLAYAKGLVPGWFALRVCYNNQQLGIMVYTFNENASNIENVVPNPSNNNGMYISLLCSNASLFNIRGFGQIMIYHIAQRIAKQHYNGETVYIIVEPIDKSKIFYEKIGFHQGLRDSSKYFIEF